MFYRIAVLDAEAAQLHRMEEMLDAYGAAHPDYELETFCFTRIKPFMDCVCCIGNTGQWAFDILIIDICLPDGNGMECARTLRENGYEGMIIFQSTSADYAVEAYEVDAIQYLLKPVSQGRFFAAVDKAAEKLPGYWRRHGAKRTEEHTVRPAVDMTLAKRQTFKLFVDTLLTKWNSRRDG